MSINHLIIGLGGTGGKIIREFRKRYFEENHDLKEHNGVFVEYLYVDSSEDDLNDKKSWKVLGSDVSLSAAQKVSTHGISMSMLHELNHYPNLNSFITRDDVTMIEAALGKLINDGIGGQRRRLGRILFANHVNGERGFTPTLENLVRNLTEKSKTADVHFHLIAGLAGGTGSGSIIDAIAQVRKKYPYSMGGTKYSLHLYLYVPENTIVNASHNAGFYQANGFASLTELNALSIGKYNPIDVSGETNIDGSHKRIDSDSPFEAAYLFSNTNENGHILDMGYGVPKMVADFLFQKTANGGNNGKMKRLETSENEGSDPEHDAAGRPTKSRKFLSFGVTRIIYPETEIQEYMTYRHAQQGTRQMLYNAWEDGLGFGEVSRESLGVGINDKVRSKEGREFLHTSDDYLTLSRPIVETETSKLWKDISKTFNGNKERFVEQILDEDREEWLGRFIEKMDNYFDKQFRTHGVKRFYEIQQKERVKYAKEIVRNIERYLFDQWSNGNMSILEIEEYLSIVEDDCRERMSTDIPKKKAALSDRIKKLSVQLKEIKDEWKNIGFFGKLFKSKPENVFNDFADAETKFHVANTLLIAYDYEMSMLTAILQELQTLKDSVKDFGRLLLEISSEVEKEAANRCSANPSRTDVNFKQYNREAIVEMTDGIIRNEDAQRNNANAIRGEIISLLGGEDAQRFANLTSRIGIDSLTDAILKICAKTVGDAVADLTLENSRYKVLNVNILEKLQEELNSNDKLRDYIEEIVKSSKSFLQFDSQEQAKAAGGKVTTPMTMLQLSLPEMPDGNNDFRQRFIDIFAETCPGFSRSDDVSVNSKVNEIVVVAAKSGFPLRHIANVKTIREAYNKCIADPKEGVLNRFVLHTESFSEELPHLYDMNKEEIGAKFLSTVLLAKALGIIQQVEDPDTQRKYHAAAITNEYGDEDYIEVGGLDFTSVLDSVKTDFELALTIEKAVEKTLAESYRANDKKELLRTTLNATLKEFVLPSFSGNPLAKGYKEAQMARNEIFDTKLKLL